MKRFGIVLLFLFSAMLAGCCEPETQPVYYPMYYPSCPQNLRAGLRHVFTLYAGLHLVLQFLHIGRRGDIASAIGGKPAPQFAIGAAQGYQGAGQ